MTLSDEMEPWRDAGKTPLEWIAFWERFFQVNGYREPSRLLASRPFVETLRTTVHAANEKTAAGLLRNAADQARDAWPTSPA